MVSQRPTRGTTHSRRWGRKVKRSRQGKEAGPPQRCSGFVASEPAQDSQKRLHPGGSPELGPSGLVPDYLKGGRTRVTEARQEETAPRSNVTAPPPPELSNPTRMRRRAVTCIFRMFSFSTLFTMASTASCTRSCCTSAMATQAPACTRCAPPPAPVPGPLVAPPRPQAPPLAPVLYSLVAPPLPHAPPPAPVPGSLAAQSLPYAPPPAPVPGPLAAPPLPYAPPLFAQPFVATPGPLATQSALSR